MKNNRGSSYNDAGVSIDRGNELVSRIKPLVAATERPGVMGGLGGFGALFDISGLGYRHPVLVSGTDGVGTKIKIAGMAGVHDTIGIDLVAMCANDLLVQGAQPLFFLDYYVCERLDVDIAEQVIRGITRGCELAGCALVGGETAEHPGAFPPGEYDLAGFCVGVVEKDGIIDGNSISTGDAIIGLGSSGPHSNGYSLIRKVLKDSGTGLTDAFEEATYSQVLLEPTHIYVKPVLELLQRVSLRGIAHITGGGLLENIPRIIPPGLAADIDCATWQWPEVFNWLKTAGNIHNHEMYRTFNCGVGMVLVAADADADTAIKFLQAKGEKAWRMGTITETGDDKQIRLKNV